MAKIKVGSLPEKTPGEVRFTLTCGFLPEKMTEQSVAEIWRKVGELITAMLPDKDDQAEFLRQFQHRLTAVEKKRKKAVKGVQ